jgi:hypothetical protein
MMQKYTSGIKIISGFAAILLLLSFFSGCVMTGNTPPINVTINSAYKTTEINGEKPLPGSIFVVTNMKIENRGDNDYMFNDNAVSITNGRLISPKLYSQLTNRTAWGLIKSHAIRSGEVIFGADDSTQDFTITFRYNKGKDSFNQEIGIIPIRAYSSSPAAPLDTVDS